MSTQGIVIFMQDDEPRAAVSLSGWCDREDKPLDRFFDDLEKETGDVRYDDPSYLAAKLVVWRARQWVQHPPTDDLPWGHLTPRSTDPRVENWSLSFLGVGIVNLASLDDAESFDLRWVVDCDGGFLEETGSGRRPKVKLVDPSARRTRRSRRSA